MGMGRPIPMTRLIKRKDTDMKKSELSLSRCPNGCVHLTLGDVSLRLSLDAFMKLLDLGHAIVQEAKPVH